MKPDEEGRPGQSGHNSIQQINIATKDLLRQALWYASERGWAVFPCVPGGKTPATAHGFKDATTDQEAIIKWWSADDDYNIGIRTGSGVLVLDVDNDLEKDEDGDAVLEKLTARSGPLPETVEAITGSGFGRHLLFKTPHGLIIRSQSEPSRTPFLTSSRHSETGVDPFSIPCPSDRNLSQLRGKSANGI